MDHLQEFMLELGNGFCFEARQKRILVDEEYYYMDMVFYNRAARFGVILELKSHKRLQGRGTTEHVSVILSQEYDAGRR